MTAPTGPSEPTRPGVLSWTDLGTLLAACISAGCDDYCLATLVRADGLARLDAGQRFDVEDYLAVLPDLGVRDMTLDAVIDLSLGVLAADGLTIAAAVERLTIRHPGMRSLIRRAAALTLVVEQTALGVSNAAASSGSPPHAATIAPLPHRFELLGFLGRGSFADVLLARERFNVAEMSLVALKVLRRSDNNVDSARFRDEAVKTSLVDHPNVLRMLDVCEAEAERPWIAFEYLEGGSLAERRTSLLDRVGFPQMVRMLEQICHGVHAIHEAGMIHCDIKPANILLTPDLVPKVADLGVAFSVERGVRGEFADSWRFAGTIGFMAPEQFRAKSSSPTSATDIYALGGLLVWLLTGAVPNGASCVEVAASLVPRIHQRRDRLAMTLADQHPNLAAIWLQATDPDPSARHQSARELAEQLARTAK